MIDPGNVQDSEVEFSGNLKDKARQVMDVLCFSREQQDLIFKELKSRKSLWKEFKGMDATQQQRFITDLSIEIDNRKPNEYSTP